MKRYDITAEFLSEKIKDNFHIETPKYWSDFFKRQLSDLITEDIEDYYDLGEIKEDINCEDLMSHETYMRHYEYICGIADVETNNLYEMYAKKLDEIENYCMKCESIISSFPDAEYKIAFSRKSFSIYIMAAIHVTEDNIVKFLQKNCDSNNVYEDYDCEDYSHDMIKIRISDHDFGGNQEYDYREPCVNIVV